MQEGEKSKVWDTITSLEHELKKANHIKHRIKITFMEEDVCNQLKCTFVQSHICQMHISWVKMLKVKLKTAALQAFFLSIKCINFLKQSAHWVLKERYVYNLWLALLLMAFCTTISTVHKNTNIEERMQIWGKACSPNSSEHSTWRDHKNRLIDSCNNIFS